MLIETFSFIPQLIILNIAFVVLFLMSEIVFSKYAKNNLLSTELVRKFSHIGAGLIFFFASIFLPINIFFVFGIEILAALFITKSFDIARTAHKTRLEGENTGIYTFVIGIIISAALFYNIIIPFQAGILILTFADSLASIIGRKFPVKSFRLTNDQKSISGSFSFFLISLIILLTFAHINIFLALLTALELMLIESTSFNGSDNILIVLLTPIFLTAGSYINMSISFIIIILSIGYAKYTHHDKRSRENI